MDCGQAIKELLVKNDCLNAALVGAVLVLTACSEASKPAASETKSEPETKHAVETVEPVSAKTAFWQMYKPVHGWASDVAPLGMVSKEVPGIKNGEGKAGRWIASFASVRLGQVRVVSYSVFAAPPDISKGVDVGPPLPWAPTRNAMPFQISEFAVDSDAAYQTAFAKAKGWVKAHPGREAALTLGNNAARFQGPVWFVLWGTNKSGYAAYVNATTGAEVNPK
jgi:hypothetical protein